LSSTTTRSSAKCSPRTATSNASAFAGPGRPPAKEPNEIPSREDPLPERAERAQLIRREAPSQVFADHFVVRRPGVAEPLPTGGGKSREEATPVALVDDALHESVAFQPRDKVSDTAR